MQVELRPGEARSFAGEKTDVYNSKMDLWFCWILYCRNRNLYFHTPKIQSMGGGLGMKSNICYARNFAYVLVNALAGGCYTWMGGWVAKYVVYLLYHLAK